jgi:hypothetical protein
MTNKVNLKRSQVYDLTDQMFLTKAQCYDDYAILTKKLKDYFLGGAGVFCFKSSKSEKKVIAACYAGLGNKLCTLIGAAYWAKTLNYKLEVYWDNCTCCMCEYSDIFNDIPNILTCESFCSKLSECLVYNIKNIISCSGRNMKKNISLLEDNDVIFYFDSQVPDYITESEASNILKEFTINRTIIDSISHFIESKKIDQEVLGLHVRKIDPPENKTNRPYTNLDLYKEYIIKNNNKKFFIATDSQEFRDFTKSFKNIITFSQKELPIYNKNDDITYRQKNAVIDGFIDMLLLSKTKIVKFIPGQKPSEWLNISSFRKCASLYSNIPL